MSAEAEVVGSRSVRAGAAMKVAAAAAAEGESLEADTVLTAGKVAVAEAVVARRVLG